MSWNNCNAVEDGTKYAWGSGQRIANVLQSVPVVGVASLAKREDVFARQLCCSSIDEWRFGRFDEGAISWPEAIRYSKGSVYRVTHSAVICILFFFLLNDRHAIDKLSSFHLRLFSRVPCLYALWTLRSRFTITSVITLIKINHVCYDAAILAKIWFPYLVSKTCGV